MNECLYRGPVLLENICGLLLRFRIHPIDLISDIEKAFLQVGLQPGERDAVRFFWLRDPKSGVCADNLITYRFTRVPFGVISSPFLLSATISYHLQCVGGPIADLLRKNISVDNVITGVTSFEEAQIFYKESKKNLFG